MKLTCYLVDVGHGHATGGLFQRLGKFKHDLEVGFQNLGKISTHLLYIKAVKFGRVLHKPVKMLTLNATVFKFMRKPITIHTALLYSRKILKSFK